MQIETQRKLFTADEYYRMAEAGILGTEERLELIDGEIIKMTPLGDRHMAGVNRLNYLFEGALHGKVIVSVQNGLRLNDFNVPQPDFVLLPFRSDFYKNGFRTKDALLVVEVSDTTLRMDSKVKLPRYAMAGVVEVWIEDLKGDKLFVYRNPEGREYKTVKILRRGDMVSVAAFPKVVFKVADILG